MWCIGWVDGGREGSKYMVRLLLDIGPPLSCQLSPSLNSWTQFIAFNSGLLFYLFRQSFRTKLLIIAVYVMTLIGSAP